MTVQSSGLHSLMQQQGMLLFQARHSESQKPLDTFDRFVRFGAAEKATTKPPHRDLVYSETPTRVIPGKTLGNIDVHDLVDPKTGARQEVYLLQQPGTGLVTGGVFIGEGSGGETPETNGLFHFTEHMLFKQTGDGYGGTHFAKGDYDHVMERNHMQINAFTSQDYVGYYFYDAPKDKALGGLRNVAYLVQNPLFDQADVDDERGTVIEEINMYDGDINWRLREQILRDLYSPHPYAMPVLGPRENIRTLPVETFKAFHLKHYAPDQRKILVIGDFDKKEVLKTLSQTMNIAPERFDNPAEKTGQSKVSLPTERQEVLRKTLYEPDLPPNQSRIYWAYRGPRTQNAKDAMAYHLIALLLGGSDASSNYQDLIRNKQWLMGLGVYVQEFKGAPGSALFLNGRLKPEYVEPVKKAWDQAIQKIKAGQVSEDELLLMKRELMTSYLDSGVQPVNQWGELVSATVGGAVEQLHDDGFFQMLSDITVDDLARVARQYLVPTQKVEYEVFSEALKPNVRAMSQSPSQAPKFAGSLNPNDKVVTTPEGAEVVIQKSLPNEHRVAISIVIPGGESLEEMPGIHSVLGRMLQLKTQDKTTSELARLMALHGIEMDVVADGDKFSITLKTDIARLDQQGFEMGTTQNFDLMIELLTEMLTRPAFQKKELEGVTSRMASNIQNYLLKPQNQAQVFHDDQWFPEQSRYGTRLNSVLENLKNTTPRQLRQWQRQLFQPENMTITVKGYLNEDHVANKLQAMTAAIQATNGRYKKPFGLVNPKPASQLDFKTSRIAVSQRPGIPHAQVFRSWAVPSLRDAETSLALSLLTTIFSGGLSTRMAQTFREGTYGGLCYTSSGYYDSNVENGRFTLYLGGDNQNLPLILHLFDEEIKTLLTTKPITQDQLDWAKEGYLKSERTNRYNIKGETLATASHRAFDYPSRQDKVPLLEGLTLERMQAILRELFENKPSLTTVLTTPEAVKAFKLPVSGQSSYDQWQASHLEALTKANIERLNRPEA